MKYTMFLLVIAFASVASATDQKMPKWQDVNNKDELRQFNKEANAWLMMHGGKSKSSTVEAQKPKTAKDVVNDIRNRPARHIPDTYREGRDWQGLPGNGGGGHGHGWGGGGHGGGWGGGWGWGRYHHASTAAQGYLDGVASVMNAQGQRAESFSRARTQNAEAFRRELLNDSLFVEQFFERRKMNREYVNAERDPSPTPEQAANWAKQNLPNRLAEVHLHKVSGRIMWPDVLTWDIFSEHREVMEKLFRIRHLSEESTGIGSTNSRWIKKIGDEFSDLLKQHMGLMEPEEYLMAKKFIDSLVYESRFEFGK